MKTKLVLFILFILSIDIAAQNNIYYGENGSTMKKKVELSDGSFAIADMSEKTNLDEWFLPNKRLDFGINGKALVKITINETGKSINARIITGINETADKKITDLIKKIKFSPALINNKPVIVSFAVSIDFYYASLPIESGGYISFSIHDGEIEVAQVPEYNEDKNASEAIKKAVGSYKNVKAEIIPMPIKLAEPVYPKEAITKKIEGFVILKILVDKKGVPQKTIVLRADNKMLIAAAQKAAMQMKFSPAMHNKKPIDCWVNIPFCFTLNK